MMGLIFFYLLVLSKCVFGLRLVSSMGRLFFMLGRGIFSKSFVYWVLGRSVGFVVGVLVRVF